MSTGTEEHFKKSLNGNVSFEFEESGRKENVLFQPMAAAYPKLFACRNAEAVDTCPRPAAVQAVRNGIGENQNINHWLSRPSTVGKFRFQIRPVA